MPAYSQSTIRMTAPSSIKFALSRSLWQDRKSTRLNSSHGYISYAVFCLKKKKNTNREQFSETIIIIQQQLLAYRAQHHHMVVCALLSCHTVMYVDPSVFVALRADPNSPC